MWHWQWHILTSPQLLNPLQLKTKEENTVCYLYSWLTKTLKNIYWDIFLDNYTVQYIILYIVSLFWKIRLYIIALLWIIIYHIILYHYSGIILSYYNLRHYYGAQSTEWGADRQVKVWGRVWEMTLSGPRPELPSVFPWGTGTIALRHTHMPMLPLYSIFYFLYSVYSTAMLGLYPLLYSLYSRYTQYTLRGIQILLHFNSQEEGRQ